LVIVVPRTDRAAALTIDAKCKPSSSDPIGVPHIATQRSMKGRYRSIDANDNVDASNAYL
jgi:hypothetical protein